MKFESVNDVKAWMAYITHRNLPGAVLYQRN